MTDWEEYKQINLDSSDSLDSKDYNNQGSDNLNTI